MSERSAAQCLVSLMSCDPGSGAACGVPASGAHACAARDPEEMLHNAAHIQRVILTGTIASGYVHDVNNLLTLLEYGASSAAEALPAGHEARADLALALQASAAIGAVTRRLLAFVRRQPFDAGVVDLRRCLEDCLPLLGRLLGSHIVIDTDLDPATWPVWADWVPIQQILLNLLVNARSAMPEGGRVTIRTANVYAGEAQGLAPGAYVCLSLADTGIGIGEDQLERVFEPFVSEASTGLGLATCRFLAGILGGAISVTSRTGEGSTFYVYLPRAG